MFSIKSIKIDKFTVYYSFVYWLVLGLASAILGVEIKWWFWENNSIDTFKTFYPNFFFSAFVILKIVPFAGLFLFITTNIRLLAVKRETFFDTYNLFLLGRNGYLRYIAIITFSGYFIFYNPNSQLIIYHHQAILLFFTLTVVIWGRIFFSLPIKFLGVPNYDQGITKSFFTFPAKLFLAFAVAVFAVAIYIKLEPAGYAYSGILVIFIIFIIIQTCTGQYRNATMQVSTLILFGSALRIVYFLGTDSFDMKNDSMARIAQVYEWERYGGSVPGGFTWLPLHHFLIYGTAKLTGTSFEVGGRILSLVSSIILIPVGYSFFRKVFGKSIAYLSLILYVMNPSFVQYATIQMTEIPFLLLITGGLYSAYTYLEAKKKTVLSLYISLLCLNMACLIRFETWVIIPLFVGVYFFTFKNIYKVSLWGLLALLSAMRFAYVSFLNTGDFLYGVNSSDVEVRADLASVTQCWDVFHYMGNDPWIPAYLIPFLFIALGYSIYKGHKQRYMAAGILLFSGYYIFKIAGLTLLPAWRYLTFVLFFSFPFLFFTLLRHVAFKPILIGFVILYSALCISDIHKVIGRYVAPPEGFFESAQFYINRYTGDNNARFILSMNSTSPLKLWKIYAGIYNDKPVFQPLNNGTRPYFSQKEFTTKNILEKITNEEYHHIVIQKGFEIDSVFSHKEMAKYLMGKKVEKNEFGDMTLLRILPN